MEFDFDALDGKQRYKLLGSTVTPRPIAWVSTLGPNGKLNAAPFSFFNVFGEDPAVVGFSIQHRSEADMKDTGSNIRLHREFVVNLVSEDNLEKMNISAIEFPPHFSEFSEAELTPARSTKIETPRIAESHVAFECRLTQIVPLGPLRSLVLGEVVHMHIDDDAVIDAAKCYIDTRKLRLVGRMEANSYVRTSDILQLPRIPLDAWNPVQS
ncbi:flavin reductase family protein [Paraburkholderia unamae]|uniref:Flavin reductase (DIM6/NTAB) family NADH-FMN oxidoreductase RutF n=1 Tax=Paraburkholderia unamae TaxID=219649 RepID=A0ABX5KJN0_9BURK|nr:flavin reductase family protein [Paraburkholderia unamae]PVX81847.1 flavin reductase (DIM6/NTAB) family NADH-FMN oxidoreductase RutF [Paraburkholderia unamae]